MDVISSPDTTGILRDATPGYRSLREHAAWLDLSQRGKIRMTGEDRARLLHAMATQHVQQMKPGEGGYAFFLNAQGRILGDANLFCFEDYFLLDTEPDTRAKIFEHLDRYIIADDVTLADESASTATIGIEGPESTPVLEKLGAPVPEAAYATKSWGDRIVARVNSTGEPDSTAGFQVVLSADQKPKFLEELAQAGVVQASPEEARVVRIEHGRPRYGEEITERYLVQETGQLQAVHFNKGCYLGQEIVERVRSRAQIHRVLRRLEIETGNLPQAGLKFSTNGTDAGEIASSAYSPALHKTVALAYMRTAFAEPGTEVTVGESQAKVG